MGSSAPLIACSVAKVVPMLPHSTYAPQPNTVRARKTTLSYDKLKDRVAYPAGKLVVLRDVQDPTGCALYTEHAKPVTAVSVAPSGHYVASADQAGQLRVWSTTDEPVTKGPFFSVQVPYAIGWDFESKRLIVGGDGKQQFGAALTADSGNSVGDISGHAGPINGVSIRPKRPLRAVTVGEDSQVVFYHGAPFKFQKSYSGHSSAVSDVKYSPDGAHFVTVGMDRKVGLFDGDSGDFEKWLDVGHTGGVLAIDWLSDDEFVTCSTDQTIRAYSLAKSQVVFTYKLEKSVDNQQVGVVVTKEYILSLGFNGDLYYWAKDGSSEEPLKVVQGHQKAITGLSTSPKLYSGSLDGAILEWTKGLAKRIKAHSAPVVAIEEGWSVGWDNKFIKIGTSESKTTKEQPLQGAVHGDNFASISESLIEVDGKTASVNNGRAIGLSSKLIAVGAGNTVFLYDYDLKQQHKFAPLQANVAVLSFSPDGSLLAAGDSSGKIVLYNVGDHSIVTSRWVFHTACVKSINWHKDGKMVVTGAADASIYVYSVTRPARNLKILNAHKDGVNVVRWDDDDVYSAGADASIKKWTLLDLSKLD